MEGVKYETQNREFDPRNLRHPRIVLLSQDAAVTALAGLGVLVAGKTAPLIHLRLKSMPPVYKCVDRIVTARPLVVAALTAVSLMTHRAIHAFHRSHSTMQVIAPPDRVRLRAHHRVALIAGAAWKGTLFSPCHRLESRTEA